MVVSEVSEMETILKAFLREVWDKKFCPVCGAPWHKKKDICKRKSCGLEGEEAGREKYVETRFPYLVELAKLIFVKRLKLKKAKKKLHLKRAHLTKNDVKILAAILVQAQLIDVDWKSIIPLKKLVRSGLFVGLSILLWLFLYGFMTFSIVNISITVLTGMLIPFVVGLFLRHKVNKNVKRIKEEEFEEREEIPKVSKAEKKKKEKSKKEELSKEDEEEKLELDEELEEK